MDLLVLRVYKSAWVGATDGFFCLSSSFSSSLGEDSGRDEEFSNVEGGANGVGFALSICTGSRALASPLLRWSASQRVSAISSADKSIS